MAITASKSFSSALKSPFLGGAIAVPAPGKAGSARDASPNSPFRDTAPAPLLMEPSARSPALPGPAAGRTIPAQGWGPLRTNLSLLHLPTRCCRTEGACPLLILVFKLRNTFHFSFVSPFWLLRVSFVPPPPRGGAGSGAGGRRRPCVNVSVLHSSIVSRLRRCRRARSHSPPRTAQPPDRCGWDGESAGRELCRSPAGAPWPRSVGDRGCCGAAPGGRAGAAAMAGQGGRRRHNPAVGAGPRVRKCRRPRVCGAAAAPSPLREGGGAGSCARRPFLPCSCFPAFLWHRLVGWLGFLLFYFFPGRKSVLFG